MVAEEPAPVVSLELEELLLLESGLLSVVVSDLSLLALLSRPVGERVSSELVEVLLLEVEVLPVLLTLTSEETLVTPCVSSARAIARPTISALSAEPLSMTSPLLASTSIEAFETWLSAWSLPFTIVSMTSSSEAPVGAPTTLSFVRTIVTPRSRSA